ncbi:MAG: inorganic phosphate transporter [Syntrophomonadaceae bacterium]|jgi:PiT family inorganic phosphate transporter|nr:inorganic phosphate transporter [Syntrophomonadaceae bacterium]
MFSMTLVMLVIVLALLFDFINGFHDTANAIASAVATKALSPGAAIILAANLNFLGAISGTAVASTIGQNIVNPRLIDPPVIVAALSGAIIWNIITWYYGLPGSSSHALIGGLAGAVIISLGTGFINWQWLKDILAVLIVTPLTAFIAGILTMRLLLLLLNNAQPSRTNNCFRKLQIVSAGMASFAHGSNDAQKSMGIITMVLVGSGLLNDFEVPFWVKIACAAVMAAGTAVGGWKIIRTLSRQIFNLRPANGFAADLTASLIIYTASITGFPVSTTHVVSSSIIGVGAAQRFRGVKWNTALNIAVCWLITVPAAALTASIIYMVINFTLL